MFLVTCKKTDMVQLVFLAPSADNSFKKVIIRCFYTWYEYSMKNGMMNQGRVSLRVRRSFFTQRVVRHRDRLPMAVVTAQSLLVFRQ